MSDDRIVEVMAKALNDKHGPETMDEVSWEDAHEIFKEQYRDDMRFALAALRAEGFDVYRPDDRKAWKFCPDCGRPNRPEDGGELGVAYCSPTNCDAWKVTATFDHETREWVPVRSEEGRHA